MSIARRLAKWRIRFLALGRAAEAGRAPGRGLSLHPGDGGAAHRTPVRHLEPRRVRGALLGVHHPQDLRDHVARPPHDHPVAHAHVLAGDLVLVVQGRVRHRHPAHEHRLEASHRGQRAGPPHLHVDPEEGGHRLLGRELVGERPAGRPRDRAEPALFVEAVDLVHDPVDLVAERLPPGLDLPVVLDASADPAHQPHIGGHPKAPLGHPPQQVAVGGGGRDAGRIARPVAEEHETPGARRPRIELAKPARRRVPRVHELALAPRALLFVQALETIEGEVDLAADLEARRVAGARETERYGSDRAHVRGDVLAPGAVPPRRRHREPAGLVAQAYRDAVELGLGDVLDLLSFSELEPFAHPPVEVGDARPVEGVRKREHGHLVDHLVERVEGSAADALGGRIENGELGVGSLQGDELREQAIVLRVGDLRRVEHVVEVVVTGDCFAELCGAPEIAGRRGAGVRPPGVSRHPGRHARGEARNGPPVHGAPGSPGR